MKEKNMINYFLIVVFIILIVVAIVILKLKEDDGIHNPQEKLPYKIVEDYNKFFTVNSCINRYLIYLQGSDTSSLLKVLDDDFIKQNSINENNIYDFLTVYENVNFNSRKMYQEEISSNLIKYYVSGYIEKDIMGSFPEQSQAYFIVKLDLKNQLFTIQPDSGEIFN